MLITLSADTGEKSTSIEHRQRSRATLDLLGSQNYVDVPSEVVTSEIEERMLHSYVDGVRTDAARDR